MKTDVFPIPLFIDGDFETNMGNCKYHCSPTCHPGQIDKDKWHYGCTHEAWPQNKHNDFVPFVDCNGELNDCDLKKYPKLRGRYIGGKNRSKHYLLKKLKQLEEDIEFFNLIKS